jgi:hypothetical protein
MFGLLKLNTKDSNCKEPDKLYSSDYRQIESDQFYQILLSGIQLYNEEIKVSRADLVLVSLNIFLLNTCNIIPQDWP